MNGYDAQDMATQGADGFRNGYQAGYADAMKAIEAARPAAAQEAVAWAVYGKSDEWPEPVLLADYVGSMDVIRKRVMEGAIREGFKGDFVERMADLGWWLEPLALAAPVTAAPGIDHAILARDIHHAIADAGLAPLSPADNHTLREVIRSVIDASSKGGSDEAAWRSPNVLPDVALGAMGWFWVAVRRESGRIYSFPATYLNALPLDRDDFDPIQKQEHGNRWNHDPPAESDECCMLATGWHGAKEHSEYDGFYAPLLSSNDELVAWRPVQDFAMQASDAEVRP